MKGSESRRKGCIQDRVRGLESGSSAAQWGMHFTLSKGPWPHVHVTGPGGPCELLRHLLSCKRASQVGEHFARFGAIVEAQLVLDLGWVLHTCEQVSYSAASREQCSKQI